MNAIRTEKPPAGSDRSQGRAATKPVERTPPIATRKQIAAARRNIKKARAARHGEHRGHSTKRSKSRRVDHR